MKLLSLSLLAAAACVGSASAQTVLHVSGSTAFRAPTTAAIIDYLSAGGHTVHAGFTGTDNGTHTAVLGAGSAIFANGTIGVDATIIIETYWTGSVAGVVDLVAGNATNTKYIDPSNMGSAAIAAVNAATVSSTGNLSGSGYGGGASITPTATTNASPDFVMSDSFNATIKSELLSADALLAPVGSFSTLAALANAVGATSGTRPVDAGSTGTGGTHAGTVKTVGVVPFIWTAGNISTPADVPTNIDMQTAKALIKGGYVAQSQLTGGAAAADAANYFYFIGRNEDSGTRIGYLMEPQVGVTGAVNQYAINSATTAGGAPADAFLFPVTALNTEPNIQWGTPGHSGYVGGGDVKTALSATEASTPFAFSDSKALANTGASYFISALGVTDATGVTGSHLLSYNGVPFSVQAVQNGQYTFWTYEHAYRMSTLSGAALTAANAIADNLLTTSADIKSDGTHQAATGGFSAGILYNSNFKVSRTFIEGGTILHN